MLHLEKRQQRFTMANELFRDTCEEHLPMQEVDVVLATSTSIRGCMHGRAGTPLLTDSFQVIRIDKATIVPTFDIGDTPHE